MQIEEFLEESADLLQWMDEADSELQTKDPSPADEDGLEELLDKIKVWNYDDNPKLWQCLVFFDK